MTNDTSGLKCPECYETGHLCDPVCFDQDFVLYPDCELCAHLVKCAEADKNGQPRPTWLDSPEPDAE